MSDIGAILETGGAAAVEFAASQIAERGGRTANCANCAEPLLGPYCAVCGQARDVHRRSVVKLLRELFQDVASFDSRILRTARALMLRPGELVCAFREGRTQPYVPPMRLYLFVSLLFFITLSLSHIALMQLEISAKPIPVHVNAAGVPYLEVDGERQMLPKRYADERQHFSFDPDASFFTRLGSRHSKISPAALTGLTERMRATEKDKDNEMSWVQVGIDGTLDKLAHNPAALNGAITEWIPRVLFALLPLFAILLSLFYVRRRQDFYFVDHLVFSLNYHSFAFALLLLAALAAQVVPGAGLGWVVLTLLSLYLLLAMRRVYRQSWIRTGVKFALLSTIYGVFFLTPAFFTIIALSVFGVGE